MVMSFQEVRAWGGGGRRRGREGDVLTSGLLPKNVTLAMAVFTIISSIYFFNKVRA
jgi:hypothetical protein